MQKIILLFLTFLVAGTTRAVVIVGRVLDQENTPVSYASIYLKGEPFIGTVTNPQGVFSLDTKTIANDHIVVSFLGYESQEHPLYAFTLGDTLRICLIEQPIALEETIVSVPVTKQRNKRKAMKELLKNVRQRMDVDFPDTPVKYRVVSDVYIDSQNRPMAFEEVIGYVAELHEPTKQGVNDSVQFYGEVCKRYIDQGIMGKINPILQSENTQIQTKHMAHEIDSGIVIHQTLWGGGLKNVFDRLAENPKRWTLSRESESNAVLTYKEKRNYLGIFKAELTVHYIIDSYTYSLQNLSENMKVNVSIPFGRKLNQQQIKWLNVLNMQTDDIEKFRLKKADATIKRNIIYTTSGTRIYVKEKNMLMNVHIIDNKGKTVPVNTNATVKVLSIQTDDVKLYTRQQLDKPVPRTILPAPR